MSASAASISSSEEHGALPTKPYLVPVAAHKDKRRGGRVAKYMLAAERNAISSSLQLLAGGGGGGGAASIAKKGDCVLIIFSLFC
jgi:hypothetical protein